MTTGDSTGSDPTRTDRYFLMGTSQDKYGFVAKNGGTTAAEEEEDVVASSSDRDKSRPTTPTPTPTPTPTSSEEEEGDGEWRDAEALLRSQPALRSRLAEVFRSLPSTGGIYSDEVNGGGDIDGGEDSTFDDVDKRRAGDAFAHFVEYVRSTLAVSPSTVIRRAADTSLERLCRTDPSMGELYDLIGLARVGGSLHGEGTKSDDDGGERGIGETGAGDAAEEVSRADIMALAAAVERMRPGKLHDRWTAASKAALRPPAWEAGGGTLAELRTKIAEGMRSKAKARSFVAADPASDSPSDDDIDAAVRRTVAREEARRKRAEGEAARLDAELRIDGEYQRYVHARELWADTGAKGLWEAYRAADWANLKTRTNRGRALEGDGAALCFEAIATVLSRETGVAASAFRYIRGARWREDDGRRRKWIGEIDLVVLRGDQVAALCEMKAGCFEVASAFAQHEAKLATALETTCLRPTEEAQSKIEIVSADGEVLRLPFCGEGGVKALHDVPIFVVTVLPGHDVLGAEPAMSQAICDGIRDQGLNVWDHTTEAAIIDADIPELLKIGLLRRAEAEAKGRSFSPRDVPNQLGTQHVDLVELERYVRAKIGPKRVSPAGCLARQGERILILPPSAIRWQLYTDPK